jgi:hypothetical protein
VTESGSRIDPPAIASFGIGMDASKETASGGGGGGPATAAPPPRTLFGTNLRTPESSLV